MDAGGAVAYSVALVNARAADNHKRLLEDVDARNRLYATEFREMLAEKPLHRQCKCPLHYEPMTRLWYIHHYCRTGPSQFPRGDINCRNCAAPLPRGGTCLYCGSHH